MAAVCADGGSGSPGVVLMHTRGRPEEWRTLPPLTSDAVLAEVNDGLAVSLAAAASVGIPADAIVLDPGTDSASGTEKISFARPAG